MTDAFAGAVVDVIERKGWHTTLTSQWEVAPPAANERPGGGTEPLTSGGDGCSGMRTGGRAQDGCIRFRGSCS